jgi:thioredoxin reductase (NADPH)
VDKARSDPKINFVLNSTVDSIQGDSQVNNLQINNVLTGEKSTLPVSGVFIAIGQRPNTAFLKGLLDLDTNGYIITNEKMETSSPVSWPPVISHNSSGRP